MISAPFQYVAPHTLEEVLDLLEQHGEEAALLAGGQSLLPVLKLRLEQPSVVIDLTRVEALKDVQARPEELRIGALTTHRRIESDPVIQSRLGVLSEAAHLIGDPQVRNRGSLGGSLAHNDPAADYPAVVLAMEADIHTVSRTGPRVHAAQHFFVDAFTTRLGPTEVLCAVSFPRRAGGAAYLKFAQRHSGFALCGVCARVELEDGKLTRVRVGVTGVGSCAYRATAVEELLEGTSPKAIPAASQAVCSGIDPLSDLDASTVYRAHLARVLTRRALEKAVARA